MMDEATSVVVKNRPKGNAFTNMTHQVYWGLEARIEGLLLLRGLGPIWYALRENISRRLES